MKRTILLSGIGFLALLALLLPLSFGGFWTQKKAPAPSASVIFGGDMLFDRYIRKVGESVGWDYPFSCIDHALSYADMVVANLEGPITDNASVALMNDDRDDVNFIFTFPPAVAPYLARHNIRLVSLGNNHTFNFGYDGIRQTLDNLDRANIMYFGAPRFPAGLLEMDESDYVMATTSLKGVPLAFVAYNEFDPEGATASAARAIVALTEAKTSGVIPILFAHWGDEYAPAPERVKKLAREFVDAGAKLVVGAHPHVVQEHEEYNGTLIYYSLGNFIFDQYWNDEVRNGLLLKATFSGARVTGVEEMSIVLQTDGRTCLSTLPSQPITKP